VSRGTRRLRVDDGQVVLVDLDPPNGTFVNGKPMRRVVRDGTINALAVPYGFHQD